MKYIGQRIFWGLFFLIGAGVLVASQLHLITPVFSFWTLVATIVLIAIIIQSIVNVQVAGIVFPIAFLGILYAEPLRITALVPWTILGAAVLVTIGLSIIVNPLKYRRYHNHHRSYYHHKNGWSNKFDIHTGYEPNDDKSDISDIDVYVKMGNSIRYIKSDDFKEVHIYVNMGNAKVYFENVTIIDKAVIDLDVSLGGVELYVPKNWNIIQDFNNSLGGVTEYGTKDLDENSPVVTITGGISLSGINITYI